MTTHKEALEAAYLAGFNASGEGYNGEYPFGDKMQDPAKNPVWKKDRDNYIKEALMSFQDGAQPEQEPVAWRYKPAREDNPRWEYTTNHPLDMGDGYIRPSLVEYCKCIEPLYEKEKPKLMLEKFREMEDLLEEPAQQEPATKEKIREAIVFNLPLYTTPPQRPSRSDMTWVGLTHEDIDKAIEDNQRFGGFRKVGFAYDLELVLKEKNTK